MDLNPIKLNAPLALEVETAKTLVTEQQVFEAADSMVAEGQEVMALNLLGCLKTGSLTTIYKYLYQWRERRHVESNSSLNFSIPDAVQNAFTSR